MTLTGKGFYIWKIPDCERGNAGAIAALAASAGLTHVLIKITDGLYSYNYDYQRKIDLVPPVRDALKARGIDVWGWQYIYGRDPAGEARIAVQRMQELGLDGFVINAEVEYKEPGKRAAATTYMRALRNGLPNTPLALSSYRYPTYHPQLPWREFLERCDWNMPQVYWVLASNPGAQLARCLNEFQNITPYRPIFPTGAAFAEHGWRPEADQIEAFMNAARDLNLTGVNFWSWDNCRRRLPHLWDTIAAYDWDGTGPPKDIAQLYIDALNERNPERVAALYTPSAVHITATRTIQGLAAIRTWYHTLFNQILPDASFTLTGFSGAGNTRHLTWTAESTAGFVHDGSATFGLLDGKIAYHYSAFTIRQMA
jgi:hypothetical protein